MRETKATLKALFTRYEWGFIGITFLLSWSIWLVFSFLFRQGITAFNFGWLFAQVGVFGPSLTALLLSGIFRKELRCNNFRTIPCFLLPLVIPGILTANSAPSGVAEFSPLVSVATVAVPIVIVLFFSSLNRRLSRFTSTGRINSLRIPLVFAHTPDGIMINQQLK